MKATTTTHTHLSVDTHFRTTTAIVNSALRALEQAEQTGSTRDWLDALTTAVGVQDFAGKELIKHRIRQQVIQAAAVLNGEFDGQEDVELGSWSDGCSPDDITDRALEMLQNHPSLWS